ncbi:ABC transporter ATP-binding protein [Amorphus orientalis]|uniref:Sn-glycerol 3-phosphate transport system ATP-binding protein n=1 Tax=Amorphus orientalis TaxID=649198 RepID=A0AAE3VR06_9HYPH|nr:ABC transporter ATP-binding protein [Amorphus orientalis]MDQ0316255.1 sn-glycerol 3-phosphate transport system ATP-binding protein [Amorphus orientalis]
MSATDFVRLEAVSKSWGDSVGVRDLSLAIPEGTFTVLLGPSGCGKSTTLRLIAGLEGPDSGSVLIGGCDVTGATPAERSLSMVFQSYALFPHLSVAENVTFGLKVRGVSRNERSERLARALSLTGLSGQERRKPGELSGGQRQRVALARAVVADHPLCLMDEPLSNLDAKLRHSVRQEIRALQRRLGMTVVYVTHDQTEAMSMADRVVLLKDGRIEQQGPPAELYRQPATAFAASFIGSPPMALIPATALPLPAELTATGVATVGLRAESVAAVRSGSGIVDGVVREAEFLGAETFVTAALADGNALTARVPGDLHLTEGASLGLSWDWADLHLFSGPDGTRLPGPSAFAARRAKCPAGDLPPVTGTPLPKQQGSTP